jgi:predicted DNA-binding protein
MVKRFDTMKVPKELKEKLREVAEKTSRPMYEVIENALEEKAKEQLSGVAEQFKVAQEMADELKKQGFFDIKLRKVKCAEVVDTVYGLDIDARVEISCPEALKPKIKELLEKMM